MSSLVVGGTVIPVAVSSPSWTNADGVDRARMFDNTFFASQVGGAAREWSFSTPPVTQAAADTYRAVLNSPAAKLCSGDILQFPAMCSPELLSGKPTKAASAGYVVLDFMLHEVYPSGASLLRYLPGDTIPGESFTRASTAYYMTTAGVLVSAAINAKRDSHYTVIGGTRSTLLEGARTNELIRSQEFDNAAWVKSNATISANATTAPDGTTTADKLQEDNTTNPHYMVQNTTMTASTPQAFSFYAKAAERSWVFIMTVLKDGTAPASWVNISTGVIGTKAATHTIRVVALASGWYRIECVVASSLTGASTPSILICASNADNVVTYLGTTGSGIYVWGALHEKDKANVSSYIPTTTTAATRSADFYSLPFTIPPVEITIYSKFVETGTISIPGAAVWQIGDVIGDDDPRLTVRFNGVIDAFHPSIGYYLSHHSLVPPAGFVLTTVPGSAPVLGNTVELNGRLFGDGSVDISQSINGAAVTTATRTAALALESAWLGQLCWLGRAGTGGSVGFIALQSFKIVAGSRSLSEMR